MRYFALIEATNSNEEQNGLLIYCIGGILPPPFTTLNLVHGGKMPPIRTCELQNGVVDSDGRIVWFSSRSPRVRFPLTSLIAAKRV